MAKVLLLSPPYLDLYGKLNKAAGRYFPLGLGYIAAYLRHYGKHEVRMIEPEAQCVSINDLSVTIKDFAPDVIGLTCSTPNFTKAIELARLSKTISKAKVVLGGVHASAIPEYILSKYPDCIDCIVCGEGEITMLEVVNAYQAGSSLDFIKGVAFSKNTKFVQNDPRPYIEDLDAIPFPARDLIPQKLFIPNLHNARYNNCASILTSRGCPFNCSFCASRLVSGRKYRMHSAEYVLSEMELLAREYNAKQLIITDDTFTVNRERLEKICQGMIDKKLNLKWFCFSQVTTVNREILRLMKRAGCYNIGFGIESGDEEILKRICKPIKPQRALEAVHEANRAGLKTQAFYVLGVPGETKAQMKKTIAFSNKIDATLTFYNMLVPYPGTQDFSHYFASVPLEKIEWENFVAIGEHCVLESSEVQAEEIESMISSAYRSYYFNPFRLLKILFHVKTVFEFLNYCQAGFALIKQILVWKKK